MCAWCDVHVCGGVAVCDVHIYVLGSVRREMVSFYILTRWRPRCLTGQTKNDSAEISQQSARVPLASVVASEDSRVTQQVLEWANDDLGSKGQVSSYEEEWRYRCVWTDVLKTAFSRFYDGWFELGRWSQ